MTGTEMLIEAMTRWGQHGEPTGLFGKVKRFMEIRVRIKIDRNTLVALVAAFWWWF